MPRINPRETDKPLAMDGRETYSATAAASVMQISDSVVYKLIHNGHLEAYNHGRRILIAAPALRAYMDAVPVENRMPGRGNVHKKVVIREVHHTKTISRDDLESAYKLSTDLRKVDDELARILALPFASHNGVFLEVSLPITYLIDALGRCRADIRHGLGQLGIDIEDAPPPDDLVGVEPESPEA